MTSYLVLTMSLVVVSVLVLMRLRITPPCPKVLLMIGAILLIAMLIFDSYLTSLPIVMYNNKSILGIKIGTIPVEDFGYLVAVILLVPALFEYFKSNK